jgi:hypothetical protein
MYRRRLRFSPSQFSTSPVPSMYSCSLPERNSSSSLVPRNFKLRYRTCNWVLFLKVLSRRLSQTGRISSAVQSRRPPLRWEKGVLGTSQHHPVTSALDEYRTATSDRDGHGSHAVTFFSLSLGTVLYKARFTNASPLYQCIINCIYLVPQYCKLIAYLDSGCRSLPPL